ncbi:MAG: copper chaperone PCu(A)C [Cocleimonas sp.]|nr:copper chaperone PCu(A)C [Cocleimonas sp.]
MLNDKPASCIFGYSLSFLILFFLSACNSSPPPSSGLEITNAWVRTPPPSAGALAGFMHLKNYSDTPIALLQAKADGFNQVMLHQSINENGQHKMEHAERIIIPPQGSLQFQHGSYHIMLMGFQTTIKSGDKIPITLIFDNKLEKTVHFIVKTPD